MFGKRHVRDTPNDTAPVCAQGCFARYPARNILVALATTSAMRSAEGAGAA